MSGTNAPARSIGQATGSLAEAPAYPAGPRNVAIWIDRQTAVMQAFWAGPPERVGAAQSGGSPQAVPGSWWARRIQADQHGPLQEFLDAILAHLAPEDEVLILGPDERKQDLCQQIEASEGQCGRVVGIGHATDLTSADVVVPVTNVSHSPSAVPEGDEPGSAPHLLAESRGREIV